MRRIVVNYDPYLDGTTFSDGETSSCDWLDRRLRDKQELAHWAGDFLEYLGERYNESIELEFHGIQQDCETMEDAVAEFRTGGNQEIRLVPSIKNAAKAGGKVFMDDLRRLYDEVNSYDCPFDELRENDDIEHAFRKGADTEFEIAVVATMSSGKSTLINAMLGKELLPARNEATTATITRIHDGGFDRFHCKYVDRDGVERSIDPVSLEDMNRLNDKGIPDINVYGKIRGIDSQALNLVLADTPGPNNSRTDDHKTHTYRLIKDSKFKPMILYVLNSTQLETMDDYELLGNIANAMKSGGRQASDRFIFVMNKADEFDTEKGESVERMIKKTKDYLLRHGISNPRIFPCSAYYAKLIRQAAAGVELTRKERTNLPGMVSLFIEDEEMHFSSKAKVSSEVRERLERRLQAAKDNGDDYAQALIHTGIPAVEEAINEYLDKYAVPAKIKEALNAFMDIIKDTEVESKATADLDKDKQQLQEIQQAIASMSAELERGEMAKHLKDEVGRLDIKKDVNAAFEKWFQDKLADFSNSLRNRYRKNSKIRLDEVEDLKREVNKAVTDLQREIAVDVENIINHEIGDKSCELVKQYNEYVESLMGTFNFSASPAALVGHLAHMRDFSVDLNDEDYSFEREEVVGTRTETRTDTRTVTKYRTEKRKVKKDGFGSKLARGFGKLFRKRDWGYEYESYEVPYEVEQTYEYDVEVDVTDRVRYVDFSKMVNDYISVVLTDLLKEAEKLALEEAREKAEELKQAFQNEFDKLNDAMKSKLAEKNTSLQDEEKRKQMIEQGQQRLAWIAGFKDKLKKAIGC